MAFLQKQLFTTPTWLLDKSILDRISSPVNDRLSQLQDQVLGSLLSTGRLQRLSNSANRDAANAYRLDEFMDDLRKGVWSELAARKPIDNYRRNLQKSFVERLGSIVAPASSNSGSGGIVISFGPMVDPKKTDIYSVAKANLRQLKADITGALAGYTDRMSKMHLQDLQERIERILNPK